MSLSPNPETGEKCRYQRPELPPELAELVDRWAELPEHIKQTILVLIKSAETGKNT